MFLTFLLIAESIPGVLGDRVLKMTCESIMASEAEQKIIALDNSSTPLETKKLNVELLINFAVKSSDFVNIIKESNGILILATLFKTTSDFDLKTKITTLLMLLSLSGHGSATTENLMNDVNVLSLVNLLQGKDFDMFMQVFGGLKAMDGTLSQEGGNSSSISLGLSAAILFLENLAALLNSSSKLLSDTQKTEILVNFTQFVSTGVMNQAATDAVRDLTSALSKNFSLAFRNFVKTLESCRKDDFSNLDMVVFRILQLIKDGKLIAAVPDLLSDNLDIIIKWLGGGKKFHRLYKASIDGYSAKAFHGKCDHKGATVTVITSSEGFVFGGYAAVPWDSSGNYKQDNSRRSFLFSLENPRHENEPPRQFPLRPYDNIAIYCAASYGPTFGNGHDIHCSDNSNTVNSCSSRFGQSYDSSVYGSHAQEMFSGQSSFTAKEIEVYQVIEV